MSTKELARLLGEIVGADSVGTDEEARRFASVDLFPNRDHQLVELVVRPKSTNETSQVMRCLNDRGLAVIPRGAGLSYSGGAVCFAPAVAIDTRAIDHIEVHADDLYAIVGAGCTWQKVADALKPFRLRAAQFSPISGSHSTVGGTAAQSVPAGTDGILGLTVVLADGSVVVTGSRACGSAFSRNYGPDLTGLFLGDCGAYGIKTEVVLRLVPVRPVAFASFAYENGTDAVRALVDLSRRGLVMRALLLDPMKNSGLGHVRVRDGLEILRHVLTSGLSWRSSFAHLIQLTRRRKALDKVNWSLHISTEGTTEIAAASQLDEARTVCLRSGDEIDDIVPRTIHARPYTISGLLGRNGERWVPVHGVLPLSSAEDCFHALRDHVAGNAVKLKQFGVDVGWLVASSNSNVTIETMFYWRDALNPVQLGHLPAADRERLRHIPDDEAARACVTKLREAHRDIMDAHRATHTQIARFYRWADNLDSGTRDLAGRLKAALDPNRRMNPGVLETENAGADQAR